MGSRTTTAALGVVLGAATTFSLGCAGGSDDDASQDTEPGGTADDGEDGTDDTSDGGDGPGSPAAMGPQGLRRLTKAELALTLELVLRIPAEDFAPLLDAMPPDPADPFDNAYRTQSSSAPLVEGMFALAEGTAAMVFADPQVRADVLGCTPAGPNDVACLRTFTTAIGRALLRRPLAADEVDRLVALGEAGVDADDFDVGAALVLQALLLDPEFLFRVENGEVPDPQAPLVALDDYEVASRLSFLLWGSGPPDWLLDRAEAGTLGTGSEVRDAAEALVADRRGLAQFQRMHALWLGYTEIPAAPDLAHALRRETDALIERALVEGDWLSIFTSEQTYLDEFSAAHYDIDLPDGPGWVTYPDIRRRGLLSHGSFLALGQKFGDTSPTERGKAVWTRLLCNEIPPPPPEVDTGLPPSGGPVDACKTERYDMRTKAECASCHEVIDAIGFGLENYGALGQWRTVEPDKPQCSISGEGSLTGEGEFAGAGALGARLVDTGQLEGCLVRNYYQFALGRPPQTDDEALVDALTDAFETRTDLVDLVLAFTESEAFRYRVVDPEQGT